MLGFLHGMILLAGVGAAALLKLAPTKTFGGLARAFVGAAIDCRHSAPWLAGISGQLQVLCG